MQPATSDGRGAFALELLSAQRELHGAVGMSEVAALAASAIASMPGASGCRVCIPSEVAGGGGGGEPECADCAAGSRAAGGRSCGLPPSEGRVVVPLGLAALGAGPVAVAVINAAPASVEAHRDALAGFGAAVALELDRRQRDGATLPRDGAEPLRHAHRLEAVGRLALGVAHDLNNTFFVIQGAATAALREISAAAAAHRDLLEISAAITRASVLVSGLLAFDPRRRRSVELLSVDDVVAGLLGSLRALLGRDVHLQASLGAEAARVRCETGSIEQLLVELCANARDAVLKGGELLVSTSVVEPSAARPGRWVRLSVSDSGPGVAAEARPRLFDPFFPTKPPGHGTGLGLAAVRGMVEPYGGFVDVVSRPGQGTAVHLCWPEVGAAQTRPAARAPQIRVETLLVIFADDSARAGAARLLRESGFRVLEAESCRAARALWASFADDVALVIVDPRAFDASGPPELRDPLCGARGSQGTLVVQSAPIDADELERLRAEGIALIEPSRLTELVDEVDRQLRARVR